MRLDDLGKSRKIYFFTIKNRGISGPNDFLSFANCGHMLASDSPFIMCCACLCAEVLFLERGLGKSKLTMEASERATDRGSRGRGLVLSVPEACVCAPVSE